jgi:hypothetical protein
LYQFTFENTLDKAVLLQVHADNGSCDTNASVLDVQFAAGVTSTGYTHLWQRGRSIG